MRPTASENVVDQARAKETRTAMTEDALPLRHRLNAPEADLVALASEARSVFAAAGKVAYAAWLDLELAGYGAAIEGRPVHEVLGVADGDRLVAHVTSYRAQRGELTSAHPSALSHFFVESLAELVSAAQRVKKGAPTVLLDFGPSLAEGGAPVAFPVDVFDRILLGFRAVLHLELGNLTE